MAAHVQKITLSIPEAVAASGIGRTTLFSLIKAGEIETVKIGSRRYVPVDALTGYINRLRAEQGGRAA